MKVGSSGWACCCLLVQVLGLALFLRGFFPVPVRSQTRKSRASEIAAEPWAGKASNWTQLPHPVFKKVVILLIDALRQDFVFGVKGKEHMPYTRQLIEKGSSLSYIAKAAAPTVTMPRIKALMTGSIPGFIDIVMNLNSAELLEDNLIWQAKQAGKRIMFYGDDTWIKLFPKHFVEFDGTTSFFVSDFTEVDDNVTRHLDDVLKRNDWEMLILHYLGLDHIGHLTGPHSHLIGPKLYEMDLVLKKIHSSLLSKDEDPLIPSLIVVCGDHGMSEAGSHGGSSDEEVQTPLLLISSAFQNKAGTFEEPEIIQQTDLNPTLALGLGLPISMDSLGMLLPAVLEHKTLREQLRFFHLNGYQLCKLLKENLKTYEKDDGVEQFKKAEKLHANWIKLYLEGNASEVLTNLGRKLIKQYLEALQKLSMSLSKQVAEYDIYSMTVGGIITLEMFFLLILSIPSAFSTMAEVDLPLASPVFSLFFYMMCLVLAAFHVIVCTSSENMCFFCSISWMMAMTIMFLISALLCILLSVFGKIILKYKSSNEKTNSNMSTWSELDLLLLVGTLGHVLSMGASSFIEEEHQTWYFLVNTLCLALSQEMCRKYFLVRKRNKMSTIDLDHEPQEDVYLNEIYDAHKKELGEVRLTILERFIKDNEKWIALTSPGVILICCRLLRPLNQTGIQWIHRSDFGHWLTRGITEARFVYIFVLGILITGIKDLLKAHVMCTDFTAKTMGLWEVYSGLILLAALLFRPHNLVVLVLCLLIQIILTKFIWKILKFDAAQITIMHYWFGQAFFFFQGNSNTISTVDVSAGFVGLENYVEMPAIFLTAFVTYTGPLLWSMHLLCYLSGETNKTSTAVAHGCYCYAIIRALPVTVYILLVTGLRYHLFIWSVFSPKLLYEVIHLVISAGICVTFTVVDKNQVAKSDV
ncbi:GPI ethanolamine phosphate transferase 2-like isoform X2 [Dendrobates tinctorius]|uniref:GPI ethanolamine phosphate transferase 2-like isoform X2 n=1 Tax=Dendrobates tinctorius TaxID=92724 RepID=UPI003CC925D9